jgi:hypothetical protein
MATSMSTPDEPISSANPESPLISPSLRYEDVIGQLVAPLPSHLIKVRPGATTRDKKRAIALAYYDWRVLVNRLNRLVGGRNWHVHLEPWGANKLICTLTILGVPKESTGEGEDGDENGGTSAEQQAKKRALAEHGLNYLYLLPEVWGDYDADKKRFVNPQALVEQMYATAHIDGLDLKPYITRTTPTRSAPPIAAASIATEPAMGASASTAVDEKTIQGIRKLCERLGKPEPDYATLNTRSAQIMLTTLTNEYRATRARHAADTSHRS